MSIETEEIGYPRHEVRTPSSDSVTTSYERRQISSLVTFGPNTVS